MEFMLVLVTPGESDVERSRVESCVDAMGSGVDGMSKGPLSVVLAWMTIDGVPTWMMDVLP